MNHKYTKAAHQRLNDILGPLTDQDLEQHHNAERAPLPTKERGPCGKINFASMAAARNAATYRMNNGANTDKLRPYFCDTCHAFHITSSFHGKNRTR